MLILASENCLAVPVALAKIMKIKDFSQVSLAQEWDSTLPVRLRGDSS
jgi:uncharacterized protein (DUF362 family)